MKKTGKIFYITWCRLAERLVSSEISIDACENIYRPGSPAWKVELTSEAAEVIKNFYIENGKPVPGVILDSLKS